jgi:hypothetical protein
MPIKEVLTRFGLEVQFFCTADPASWDPLWGKSPVHVAAEIHSAALKVALKKNRKKIKSTYIVPLKYGKDHWSS